MLSVFLRILFYLSALLLVGKFLRSVFTGIKKTKGSSPFPPSHPTAMVKDPVCGMYLDPKLALSMGHKNEILYFCSNECRQKFTG